MPTADARAEPLVPTALDVREHRRLRRASMRLTARLRSTFPERAFEGIERALDIYDETRFPSEATLDVLADCCLHEPTTTTPSLARVYADGAPRLPADERRLLELWRGVRCALLRIDAAWPGVGLRVHDEIEGSDLVLLERALSREPGAPGSWLVAWIFPVDRFWMTTEARVVVGRIDDEKLRTIRRMLDDVRARGVGVGLALASLGAMVQASREEEEEEGRGEEEQESSYDGDGGDWPGAAETGLIEAGLWDILRPPQREPRPPGRNEPCPCGSGRKHKKCCALVPRPGR